MEVDPLLFVIAATASVADRVAWQSPCGGSVLSDAMGTHTLAKLVRVGGKSDNNTMMAVAAVVVGENRQRIAGGGAEIFSRLVG